MAYTEFFKTLAEAEHWAKYDMHHKETDVYSVDKPGTVLAFGSERRNAVFNEGRNEARNARAVVKVFP